MSNLIKSGAGFRVNEINKFRNLRFEMILSTRLGERNAVISSCRQKPSELDLLTQKYSMSTFRFNVAEIGAMSRDIPNEAKVLVKRMINDPHVNVTSHWKLVTILIGPNDFCSDFCYQPNPEKSVKKHKLDLMATLRILRDNLPRTMVNLVTPPCK